MRRAQVAVIIACFLVCSCASHPTEERPSAVADQAMPSTAQDGTLVVMLGTGTPNPDPERSGPATAVIAGGQAYLVDCGPGVVRRAEASWQSGIDELDMSGLTRLFVTHLHSDHTAGYADLILTPWVLGREQPLEVYGPPGIRSMTDHILAAYAEDIDIRLHDNQPQNEPGITVEVHEIASGEIYRDDHVTVTAFAVPHGAWEHAFGFRFDNSDRSVVITGDTTPSDEVVEACSGCDVLVHEVYAKTGFDGRSPDWQAYHKASHTSGVELGEIAARARPKLLILNHQLMWGATEDELLAEIRRSFYGEVAFADDLDVY
jgi:ribonuclease BN (tRNA processing enzyme)